MGGAPPMPNIPPPLTPPPPPPALPPPAVGDPAVQQAEVEARRLSRRRGIRTTLLTPGGAAGVTTGTTPTRKTLLGE